jgi:hypothetical protein
MTDVKTLMLAASIVGIFGGAYYTVMVNPLNNYAIFMVLFAVIGVAIANVVLLIVSTTYEWLKSYYSDPERMQASGAT